MRVSGLLPGGTSRIFRLRCRRWSWGRQYLGRDVMRAACTVGRGVKGTQLRIMLLEITYAG